MDPPLGSEPHATPHRSRGAELFCLGEVLRPGSRGRRVGGQAIATALALETAPSPGGGSPSLT